MKKPGGRDARQDSASEGEVENSENFRGDRGFSTRPPVSPVSPAPSALMSSASGRAKGAWGSASAETSSELALRRDLSRLQRQVADTQRELANKDDQPP